MGWFLFWCGRRDLNPYGVNHTPLKRARLPVPPLSQALLIIKPKGLYCQAKYILGISTTPTSFFTIKYGRNRKQIAASGHNLMESNGVSTTPTSFFTIKYGRNREQTTFAKPVPACYNKINWTQGRIKWVSFIT